MFWTCELRGTTRVFSQASMCRLYADEQLTVDGHHPRHLFDEADSVHFFYNDTNVARCQPLSLRFAGNPNGQVILIAGGEA